MTESVEKRRERTESFDVRTIHPNVRFGTASDRYAGWIGQIYSPDYQERVSSRRRKLGGKSYEERTVPVESVHQFFEHFDVLEIDYTFYRPLRDPDGEATSNFFTLNRYAEHAPPSSRFLLKAPQTYFARKLRRRSNGKPTYEENPDFLNLDAYVAGFHQPAQEILGDRLSGIIFEQEYQRVSDSPSASENVEELDAFFAGLPGGVQPHLEIRSPHLLDDAYFGWLEDRGLGFVFSHWTWLPPIRKQWRMCGERFTASNGEVVVRLLTPLDMPYAKAYAKTHPFDKPVPEISASKQARNMVMDTTALVFQAEARGNVVNVVTNNRAWGNAPALAREIARRILDEEERRSGPA
ncbi:MAG: DUF72 domain-containing protein [Rhodothermia bacterium]|nr:DUF72 domain-containing protein [Rhodothermia bacterium]